MKYLLLMLLIIAPFIVIAETRPVQGDVKAFNKASARISGLYRSVGFAQACSAHVFGKYSNGTPRISEEFVDHVRLENQFLNFVRLTYYQVRGRDIDYNITYQALTGSKRGGFAVGIQKANSFLSRNDLSDNAKFEQCKKVFAEYKSKTLK